jgi:hypothetical protein
MEARLVPKWEERWVKALARGWVEGLVQGMATELVEKLVIRSALVMECSWAWKWAVAKGRAWVVALALLSEVGKEGALGMRMGVRMGTRRVLPLVKAVERALAVGSAVQLGEV